MNWWYIEEYIFILILKILVIYDLKDKTEEGRKNK